ncbi:hypothetical protein Nepgr_031881 [Nepenthes gracilis]|uniref:Uncharacterized protein n=1 Tax=Nepenthes gracilis TaxID=150966 RepID=A0AAD3TJH3_NEPGR|nr:hypothetical protein Nepgr_031881 [Nepenthes gracilis]
MVVELTIWVCLWMTASISKATAQSTAEPTAEPTATGLYLGIGTTVIVIAAAVILPLLFRFCTYKMIKKRRENRIKAKFFKQNGGLLLKQQMSSSGGIVDKTRIFTSKELEMAIDYYNKDRILGKGGQGKKKDILVVANLARRCLNLDGKRRPTMKEAAKELEAVGASYMPPLSEKYLL